MDMGCYFYKYFYFISLYSLASFLSYIIPFQCKTIKKLVTGAPDSGKKETKEIERT